jgi:putative SOS response-associated peptidase YedK
MARLRTRTVALLTVVAVTGGVAATTRAQPAQILVSVAAVVFILSLASFLWTTVTARRLLRRALGRSPRALEESSIEAWMRLPAPDLEHASAKLRENPFESALETLRKANEPTTERPKRLLDQRTDSET